MLISIIVPTLNEQVEIERLIGVLKALGGELEILIADGGSTDRTVALAEQFGVTVVHCAKGRGQQMLTAATQARGDVFWFVHADTEPPPSALNEIRSALENPDVIGGNFGLIFDGNSRAARCLTVIYPGLRLMRLCYGDSGFFIRKVVYHQIGGFRVLALFEDLDLLRRMRRAGRFAHLQCAITTSSRRFEQRSFALIWLHWTALQILYWIGAPPNLLARWYSHVRRVL